MGPTSACGKAVASSNAVRHGLQARAVLLPDERLDAYEANLSAWMQALAPATQAEADLVAGVADLTFRAQRLTRIEERNLRANLEARVATSKAGRKLKTAREAMTALESLTGLACGGPARGNQEDLKELYSAMRTVHVWVAMLGLSPRASVQFDESVNAIVLGRALEEDLPRAYEALAAAGPLVMAEIQAQMPIFTKAAEEERERLLDEVVLSDDKQAKRLERVRGSLHRHLEGQLGLTRQVKELATMSRR